MNKEKKESKNLGRVPAILFLMALFVVIVVISNAGQGILPKANSTSTESIAISELFDPSEAEKNCSKRIDLFAVGGQSNAEGHGEGSPNVISGAYEVDGSTVKNLSDPVGDADTGSAWPAFAKKYHSATGRCIAIVELAKGSTAQAAAANGGAGNWDTSGSLRGNLVSGVKNAITTLQNKGFNVRYKGILWSQGERDAQAIDSGDITKSDYKTAFQTLTAYFETQLGGRMYVARTGTKDSGDTSGFQDVRDAQDEIAAKKDFVVMAFTDAVDFPAEGKMADNLHYDQDGLDEMGRAMAASASS